MVAFRFASPVVVSLLLIAASATAGDAPQYEFDAIKIPAASANEPTLPQVDVDRALKYLDDGAVAWTGSRKCVTCHTTGTYLVTRPALTAQFGPPRSELRQFFVGELHRLKGLDDEQKQAGIHPAQVVYIAAGLAEWDAHVTGTLSPEDDEALRHMLSLQLESGTYNSLDCWPPYESSAFQEATVAAMAVATAPGWLAGLGDDALKARVEQLKHYLRTTPPPQDHDRALLLWTATRMPDLLDESQRAAIIDMLWSKQNDDGGWALRDFGKPEEWGGGNRAEKLRSEPEFANPPSDGHQTGLAVLILRDAGVPASDPRIQSAVKWLLANQRESGRWWTRSLNTDSWHFITYSGTAYPLLALSKCDALPKAETAAK